MVKTMLRFQVWTIHRWKQHARNLLNYQKPLPSFKQPGEEPQTQPGGKGKSRQTFGRQRVLNIARDQQQSDDRPAQVVGRTQRPRPQSQQRRGTDL